MVYILTDVMEDQMKSDDIVWLVVTHTEEINPF